MTILTATEVEARMEEAYADAEVAIEKAMAKEIAYVIDLLTKRKKQSTTGE